LSAFQRNAADPAQPTNVTCRIEVISATLDDESGRIALRIGLTIAITGSGTVGAIGPVDLQVTLAKAWLRVESVG
jgi:hypothetical protein